MDVVVSRKGLGEGLVSKAKGHVVINDASIDHTTSVLSYYYIFDRKREDREG